MIKILFTCLILLSVNIFHLSAQSNLDSTDLLNLEKTIQQKEKSVEGLKPDNHARIIWAKDQEKTDIAFVYLHGFGASQREGMPIMELISKKYRANVFMARLAAHGIYRDDTFKELTESNYIESATEALKVGRQIGDKVVLVSTSTGGTLSLTLAADNPDIAAVILYSPFIDLINPAMAGIIEPGGLDKYIEMNGSDMVVRKRPEEEAKYWSTNYHANGYFALISLLKNNMKESTFSNVTCPVFMGYYYKNEKEQDQVVSVAAMHKMFNALGTADFAKRSVAFPSAGNHVIGCDLRSNSWKRVYSETVKFIDKHLK